MNITTDGRIASCRLARNNSCPYYYDLLIQFHIPFPTIQSCIEWQHIGLVGNGLRDAELVREEFARSGKAMHWKGVWRGGSSGCMQRL